jgi:hypothetical protein
MIWELQNRFAIIVLFALGITLLTSENEILALGLSWLGTFVAIVNYMTSTTLRLGPHWRTIPLFMFNMSLSIFFSICSTLGARYSHSTSVTLGSILIVLSCCTAIVLYLLPVPTMPTLCGKYGRIGTHSFQISVTLPSHSQVYKDAQSYLLPVQCWFPLPNNLSQWEILLDKLSLRSRSVLWSSGDPNHQIEESSHLLDYTAQDSKLPTFIFRHLALSTSHSKYIPDMNQVNFSQLLSFSTTPAVGGLPVAIYSHGMYSWRQIASTTFEALASNGYIVFSVDHSPSAMVSRPPKSPNLNTVFDYYLPPEIAPGSEDERVYYQGGVNRRATELKALIDYLQTPSANELFSLDCNCIHVFGHSFGGGSVAAAASRDSRIASCVMCESKEIERYR